MADTLDWVLQQPWQDGHIALQGGSYLGVTQWAMAGDLPAEVKTFVATVSHGDIYQLAYRNGVFNQAVAGAWLHAQFRPWYRLITAAGRWREKVAGHYPAKGVDPAEFGKTWQAYSDYISHPERDDPYWQSAEYVAMREAHRKVSVPVMMIGSANDFFLPGMLPTFAELPARVRSVFMLGPGNHGGQAEDEVDGSYTNDYIDTLAWFDHHLKGAPLPDRLKPGFNVFVHGQNVWRFYPDWPESTATLQFQLDRLADAQACDGGALSTGSAAAGQQAQFVYDPRNPVPRWAERLS
jgi:putative CocE/NonD family hydrolase